jgi:putative copper resistance protein D
MSPDAALIVCRFVHDAAAMLLWGGAAYLAALVPGDLADDIARRLGRSGFAAIALAVATTAATLPIEAARLGDGWADAVNPDVIHGYLFETAAGWAWMWQATAAIALLLALSLPGRARTKGVALASGALLLMLALTGHAVMHDGWPGYAQRMNDMAHVLSAGAWFGALVPLAVILRRMTPDDTGEAARTALKRFSVAGHITVALAILTGAANTLFILGRPPVDWSSAYQALLSAKIAVVAVMVALALANGYVAMPRMNSDNGATVAGLRRCTLAEIALGLAAIALVAIFGTLDPLPG